MISILFNYNSNVPIDIFCLISEYSACFLSQEAIFHALALVGWTQQQFNSDDAVSINIDLVSIFYIR